MRHESPPLDAELLLRHVLGMTRAALYTHPDRPLTAAEASAYGALLARRAAGEPVAYLTGHREFMGLDFIVDHRVLVPRPETELLVERALASVPTGPPPSGQASGPPPGPSSAATPCSLWTAADVGTGSGAIAVSLAASRLALRVYAVDVSAGALAIAVTNARRLLGPSQVQVVFVQTSLLGALNVRLHLIVANLPYIPAASLDALTPTVRDYEPRLALNGGMDGLQLYRDLLRQAPERLLPGGTLLMECDPGQAWSLRRLALTVIPGATAMIHPDLAGMAHVVEVHV